MFTFFMVFAVYRGSMYYLEKYAGRQNPLWGLSFSLFSFVTLFVLTIFIMAPFKKCRIDVTSCNIFMILAHFLNAIIIIAIALKVSKKIKKIDIRSREKVTWINFKWSTIGFLLLLSVWPLFIYYKTEIKSLWILGLIPILAVRGLNMHRRSLSSIEKIGSINIEDEKYIIFLRDFKIDKIKARPKNVKLNFFDSVLGINVEQYLEKYLPKHIVFIALGSPNDYIPTLGAKKIYLPDKEWKDYAANYIQNATLIVILEGISEGLQWELSYIRENILPNQVKIISLPKEFKKYSLLTGKQKKQVFKRFLAKYNYVVENEIEEGKLISFDKNWKADKYESYEKILNYLPLYDAVEKK